MRREWLPDLLARQETHRGLAALRTHSQLCAWRWLFMLCPAWRGLFLLPPIAPWGERAWLVGGSLSRDIAKLRVGSRCLASNGRARGG